MTQKLRIKATPTRGGDLKPGDLFSTAGPKYWGLIDKNGSIGERVYIRTEAPCPQGEESEEIYRIEIELYEAEEEGSEKDRKLCEKCRSPLAYLESGICTECLTDIEEF